MGRHKDRAACTYRVGGGSQMGHGGDRGRLDTGERGSWWWDGVDRGGGRQRAGRRSAWRAAHGVEGTYSRGSGATRRGSDASHGTHILVIH